MIFKLVESLDDDFDITDLFDDYIDESDIDESDIEIEEKEEQSNEKNKKHYI